MDMISMDYFPLTVLFMFIIYSFYVSDIIPAENQIIDRNHQLYNH